MRIGASFGAHFSKQSEEYYQDHKVCFSQDLLYRVEPRADCFVLYMSLKIYTRMLTHFNDLQMHHIKRQFELTYDNFRKIAHSSKYCSTQTTLVCLVNPCTTRSL